jgi:hypothetical protein
MRVKFITTIYSDLYGTDVGGRPHRHHHYRHSLLSLLKMTNADFLCYTSDREIESLKMFFQIENNISENKLKFETFDLNNSKFSALINSIKNVDEIKKSDRCIELQYSKFSWWWNEDKSYDYYYWIDAGLSYNGLIPPKYLNFTDGERILYESNLFNNLFLENLIADTNDKFLILGKDNQRFFESSTVDPKWYTTYSNHIHVIGGLFGGHKDKWDNIVNIFENYVVKILSDSITFLPHEEQIMSLMFYNHTDLFVIKYFDIWWPVKEVAPKGISDTLFVENKCFYKILEEFNGIC